MAFTFKSKTVIAWSLPGENLFRKADQAKTTSLIAAGLKSADPKMVAVLTSFEKRGFI